ncbi:jun dimerization protein 2-like [Lepus europaeus]|uniref:jun dimerization protein 2-like n=1 Tax=Lepus europaeus TaxID=9983 RepID=UPI002B4828EA|nr:jun dimerization protein 2-like [Lepus europaeus]
MMTGQIPDPFVTTGSLPGQDPLNGWPGSALIVKELKCIGTIIVPLLEVKLDKRPQPVKSKLDEKEERRKKNKAVWARRKERTESLQREFERLEFRNTVLKMQIRELEQARQQLILVLNRRRPTCIVHTDSVPGCAAGHRGLPLGPNINGCGAYY